MKHVTALTLIVLTLLAGVSAHAIGYYDYVRVNLDVAKKDTSVKIARVKLKPALAVDIQKLTYEVQSVLFKLAGQNFDLSVPVPIIVRNMLDNYQYRAMGTPENYRQRMAANRKLIELLQADLLALYKIERKIKSGEIKTEVEIFRTAANPKLWTYSLSSVRRLLGINEISKLNVFTKNSPAFGFVDIAAELPATGEILYYRPQDFKAVVEFESGKGPISQTVVIETPRFDTVESAIPVSMGPAYMAKVGYPGSATELEVAAMRTHFKARTCSLAVGG